MQPSVTNLNLSTGAKFLWTAGKLIVFLWKKKKEKNEIISQKCTFTDPFQKVFAKFWLVQKHGFGPLKISGERLMVILALLVYNFIT